MLSYVQGGSVDVWKENILEDLEIGNLEYEIAEEFLADLEKEFGGRDKKPVKVAELKRLEQRNKMMEEFVQKFRKVARRSKYKKRPLIEEFKQEMNGRIQQRLIEPEFLSIEQWYHQTINLDRN